MIAAATRSDRKPGTRPTEKARYAEATPQGIDMRPLMGDHVPATGEEVADFRRRVDQSPAVRTFLISNDGTATLIKATFLELSKHRPVPEFADEAGQRPGDSAAL